MSYELSTDVETLRGGVGSAGIGSHPPLLGFDHPRKGKHLLRDEKLARLSPQDGRILARVADPDTESWVALVVVAVGCARLLRCARLAPGYRLANSRELSLLSRRGRQYAPSDQRGRSPAAWSATWNRDSGPATS
jgi:hypothetical protein